jgi:hypothetical protein
MDCVGAWYFGAFARFFVTRRENTPRMKRALIVEIAAVSPTGIGKLGRSQQRLSDR